MAKAENESESCRPGNQADALEYCNVELHLPQFSVCCHGWFLRILDDLLNLRNPCGTGFKAPMHLKNREWWIKRGLC